MIASTRRAERRFGPRPAAPTPSSPAIASWRANTGQSSFAESDRPGRDGQESLSNAFALERIHQAYLLTGVRGVGKTTTARILARAFNYEVSASEADGRRHRTSRRSRWTTFGIHCQAIIESRHVDVIEMDAASHTGIDDVREIDRGDRATARVMARMKVYIIDEVHMLSKAGVQRLLKTLEEPPDARQIPVRDDRDRQGSGHGALALSAVRPAARSMPRT